MTFYDRVFLTEAGLEKLGRRREVYSRNFFKPSRGPYSRDKDQATSEKPKTARAAFKHHSSWSRKFAASRGESPEQAKDRAARLTQRGDERV